eukprot:gnl/MRDRNA2_/MRDRNA2_24149_c0_seq1.p1 gnl/MRDRNA2_/MRDRNA2_24149_c0~~gnl/MRDRNA2_/MRDRNA2_24149_c0_seq1.p1  ORF type:complete len:827 (+),score=164.60 gnl/MRDRNA2_/MRDRNA2_24149_c0_seq1:194-2482(+)
MVLVPEDWANKQNLLAAEEHIDRKDRVLSSLEAFFETLDFDGSGYITYQEFFHMSRENDEFMTLMHALDILDDDIDAAWHLLDINGDGQIDKKEFLDVMWRLQSEETKWTLLRTSSVTAKMSIKLDVLQRETESGFKELTVMLKDQREALHGVLQQLGDANVVGIDSNWLVAQGLGSDKLADKQKNVVKYASNTGSADQSKKRISSSEQHSLLPVSSKQTISSEQGKSSEAVGDGDGSDTAADGSDRVATVTWQDTHDRRPPSESQDHDNANVTFSLPLPGSKGSRSSAQNSKSSASATLAGVAYKASDASMVPPNEQNNEVPMGSRRRTLGQIAGSVVKKVVSSVAKMNVEKSLTETLTGDEILIEHNADLAEKYMSGVNAREIARFGSEETIDFWSPTHGRTLADVKVRRVSRVDYFISHCWSVPPNWNEHFNINRRHDMYEYKKALQLQSTLQFVRRTQDTEKPWQQYVCWVDKACIPQDDEDSKAMCINLIEEFLKLSDGLIVLLTWHYFTRLWCIYEWACFLVLQHPLRVHIGVDVFLKHNPEQTLSAFLQSIEEISVKDAQCNNEGDRAILEEKVFRYYRGETREESFASFERFAKYTAISLIARDIIMWRARVGGNEENKWLQPLRDIAKRLEFTRLHAALEAAQPAKWYNDCQRNGTQFELLVGGWIDHFIIPALLSERNSAVRTRARKALETMKTMRSPSGRIKPQDTLSRLPTNHGKETRKTLRSKSNMSQCTRTTDKDRFGGEQSTTCSLM